MRWLPLVYVVLAAVSFAVGGVAMKASEGLTRWPGTLGTYALFALGATFQALALKGGDLGIFYVLVLGLEAVLAFGFGVALFHEAASPMRLAAVALIVAGIAILR
jgi:small multidrug resistance pump/quaternary ammonium compound-resistance protein SugE